MSTMKFIDVKERVDDLNVKNKWRWAWLEEMDSRGSKIGLWCKKISEVGYCYCIMCNKKLNYGSNGKKALLKHSNDAAHLKWMKSQDHTATLPGAEAVQAKPSLSDRIAHQKAIVTSFMCENALPFSLAPKLIELCQKLATDKPALNRLKMSRTTATYITTHGTAKCMRNELVTMLKGKFFSLNIDEATNNASDKILNVMVRFYDETQRLVVTDHLGSKRENVATALNLFQKVKDLITENGLKMSQVVSCLMDNCNTMRGAKGGVETLMRKDNPNLLNIHGDVVHIVNNAAKMFFGKFNNFIESFASDVYYDIVDSPKAKQLFSEVQVLLNLTPKNLLRPIETRFCQMFAVTNRLSELEDSLIVYYYSFLSIDEKNDSGLRSLLKNIYDARTVSDVQLNRIKSVQDLLSKQKVTDAGKARKERILRHLLHLHSKFVFFLKFYRGILTKFNVFIKLFQREAPMLHMIHAEMYVFCKNFLSLFIKAEFLPENSVKELLAINVEDKDKQLTSKFLSVGKYAYSNAFELQRKRANWIPSFYSSLREAYSSTAKYLMRNMPLENKVLLWLSALNPKQRRTSSTMSAFNKLSECLPQIISEEERSCLLEEIRLYTTDSKISELEAVNKWDDGNLRIDKDWWAVIFEMKTEDGSLKYQHLMKIVKALLSVFSGPLVEGTFNIMDDIIRSDRSCLTVENYEATSIIKYNLRRRRMKAVDLKPTPKMCNAIHSAYSLYRQAQLSKKEMLCLPEKIDKVNSAKSTSDPISINSSSPSVDSIPCFSGVAVASSGSQSNDTESAALVSNSKKRHASNKENISSKKAKSASITNYFFKK